VLESLLLATEKPPFMKNIFILSLILLIVSSTFLYDIHTKAKKKFKKKKLMSLEYLLISISQENIGYKYKKRDVNKKLFNKLNKKLTKVELYTILGKV
jgi:hypothetical protein